MYRPTRNPLVKYWNSHRKWSRNPFSIRNPNGGWTWWETRGPLETLVKTLGEESFGVEFRPPCALCTCAFYYRFHHVWFTFTEGSDGEVWGIEWKIFFRFANARHDPHTLKIEFLRCLNLYLDSIFLWWISIFSMDFDFKFNVKFMYILWISWKSIISRIQQK